jgi:hypothetical protein
MVRMRRCIKTCEYKSAAYDLWQFDAKYQEMGIERLAMPDAQ